MIANANEGRNAAGKALFMRLPLIKANDRRRYERDLLAAREVAKTDLASERESSELREQFIAVLGHDLRNPLASISAGARLLGRGAKTDKEHQIIAMLETTVLRMAGLIDNVLDFARGRLGGGITLDRRSRPFAVSACQNSIRFTEAANRSGRRFRVLSVSPHRHAGLHVDGVRRIRNESRALRIPR